MNTHSAITVRDFDIRRLIQFFFNKTCVFCCADVNGKVVHLVQRPPPGSTPRAVSGNSSDIRPRRHTENGRNNLPIFQVIDGTVLGAMAIPMNTNSGVSKNAVMLTTKW